MSLEGAAILKCADGPYSVFHGTCSAGVRGFPQAASVFHQILALLAGTFRCAER